MKTIGLVQRNTCETKFVRRGALFHRSGPVRTWHDCCDDWVALLGNLDQSVVVRSISGDAGQYVHIHTGSRKQVTLPPSSFSLSLFSSLFHPSCFVARVGLPHVFVALLVVVVVVLVFYLFLVIVVPKPFGSSEKSCSRGTGG